MSRKVLLIHGYSDQGASFRAWADKLRSRGVDMNAIGICNYITLNNEVTIPDIAEGLTRAVSAALWPPDQEFDAIVHSTGMLVVRAWLANNPSRRRHLKHLVGLAPATWGSPLAHLGSSLLGSIVHGNHEFGPDFLNAGNRVLEALELGSKFTWDLAHRDVLGPDLLFTEDDSTPYVAVFIGNTPYPGIKELINKPGTDGTVRWSGCALNTRKITVDLTRPAASGTQAQMMPWPPGRLSVPMFAVEGKNHTTLLREPEDDLADRVVAFFQVDSSDGYNQWARKAEADTAPALAKMKNECDGWQQFVVHVSDEFGESVKDYAIDIFNRDPRPLQGEDLDAANLNAFDSDVHSFGADASYRCFHVKLPQGVMSARLQLWLRLLAASGTNLIRYRGFEDATAVDVAAQDPIVIDMSQFTSGADSLFCPFTTTLIEIRLNRQPAPSLMTLGTYD